VVTNDEIRFLYARWESENLIQPPPTPQPPDTPEPFPFNDVPTTEWFYNYIRFVFEQNIMQGTDATTFAPNATLSRAMLVTILHRLADEPAPTTNHGFSDVAAGQWYTDAVAWALENGIVQGVTDDRFAPDDPVTREQFAAMLHRYAVSEGMDVAVSPGANLDGFADAYRISDWAEDAVLWAYYHRLITGRTATAIVPDGIATRAETAAILQRFVALL